MASLLKWVKDRAHDTASVSSRAVDQLNPLDNGRTWKQRTPTNDNSAPQQATHNSLTNLIGDILKPVVQTGMAVNQGIGNAELKIAGRPTLPADQFFGKGATNFTGYTGTKRQIAGDALNTALTVAAPGAGKVIDKSFAAVAPKVIPKLAVKAVANAGTGAVVGAPFGASSFIASDQPFTRQGLQKSALQGAQAGAVLGAGAAIAPPVLKAGGRQVVKGAKQAPQLAVKLDQKLTETPQTSALRQTNKTLQQQFDTVTSPTQRRLISQQITKNNAEIRATSQGGYVKLPGDASDELAKNVFRKGTDANSLYHGTKFDSAVEILKSGKLKASKPNASRELQANNPNAQVSLSRQRNSGFYNGASSDVKFVVDKNKIGKTKQYVDGELSPSDHKNPLFFEAEEQTKKDIPMTSVKRVEGGPLLEPGDEAALRALAAKHNIPFVAFDDVNAMRKVLPSRESKLSTQGGKRPANTIQSQIEAAHNAGDHATVAKLIPQLPADMQAPMKSAMGLSGPGSGQKLVSKGRLKVGQEPRSNALQPAVLDNTNTSVIPGQSPQMGIPLGLESPTNTATLVRSPSRVPSLTTNNTTIPQGFKERGLTKSVKTSGEVSPIVQGKVGGIYKPHNMSDIQAQADARVQGDLAPLTDAVNNTLATKRGSLTDQQVADSIALAKAHDAAGNFDAAQNIYDKLAEHGTAGGQQINAFKLLSNRTPEGMKFKAYRDLKKQGITLDAGEQLELEGLVSKVKQAPFGPERDMALHDLVRYVSRKIPSKAGDKVANIWRAGLLTSPVTTGGNILGNTTEALTRNLWANPTAALADKAMSLFTGKRTKTLQGGQISGAKAGFKKAGTYLKTGYDERNPLQKYDAKNVHYDNKFVDNYVNGVYRWMGGQDQPFYYSAQNQAVKDLALADAKNLGLKGQARNDYVNQAGPDFKPQTFKSKSNAETAAKYAVYQNETKLGAAAQGLKKPLGPIGDFLVPFSSVPASVAMRILDRTPVGIGKELLTQIKNRSFDQRALAEAIGNGSFGPGVILAGYSLGKQGLITGAYPTDQKEQELWKLEGKQPYSVHVGGQWLSLNYIQPFGTLLAIGNQSAADRKEGKSPGEIVSTAVGAAAKSVESQSFLQGINGLLSAVNDPQRSASQYVTSTASSVVPNFIRTAARATDPNQRDVKGALNGVKGAIPGVRESLPIKQDAFGGNLPAVNNAVNQFLNPLRPSIARPGDTVTNEMRRLQDTKNGIIPTQFSKTAYPGTTLTDQQVRELQTTAGTQIKATWDKIIQDPQYQALSDADKATALKKGMDSINEAVKSQFAQANNISTSGKLSQNAQSVLKGTTPNVFNKNTTTLTGNAAIDKLTQQKADTSKAFKASLSPEDYKLATMSKTDRQKLLDSGGVTQKKLDGLDNYVRNKKVELGMPMGSTPAKTVANPVGERYASSNTKTGKWVQHIQTEAPKRGLDMDAVLAVAAAEGLGGGVGDGGTSYGPFQLHIGGALPPGKDQAWAESPEGLNYALDKIATVAKGKKGQAAVDAIVRQFEQPADPNGEVSRAMSMYGRVDAYTKLSGSGVGSTNATKAKKAKATGGSGSTRRSGSTSTRSTVPKSTNFHAAATHIKTPKTGKIAPKRLATFRKPTMRHYSAPKSSTPSLNKLLGKAMA